MAESPGSPNPPPSDGAASKEKRSKNGCGLCRARRIKCDEVKPTCGPCEKRGFECVYDPSSAGRADISFALARRRSRAACVSCRTLKRRCTAVDGDDKACARCRRLSLPCEWARPDRKKASKPSPTARFAKADYGDQEFEHDPYRDSQDFGLGYNGEPSHSGYGNGQEGYTGDQDGLLGPSGPLINVHRPSGDISPGTWEPRMAQNGNGRSNGMGMSKLEALMGDRIQLLGLMRSFFGTVHQYGFLTFIHEPSFLRLLEKNKAPSNLTRLMAALSLRFDGDGTSACRARADELFEEAFVILKDQMYSGFGAVELMCTLLARTFEHCRGKFYSSWMLWGNSVRMMQFLSLHVFDEVYPQPHAIRLNPMLKPEALRRLAWAVFYLDTMADAGRHGIHTVTETGFHLQLPADDNSFLRGQDVVTAPLEKHPSTSSSPSVYWDRAMSPHPDNLGVPGHLIRTAAMRRRILHFNSLLKYSKDTPEQMTNSVTYLENDLRAVITDLPASLSYSEDSLLIHSDRRTLFILLHMLRHNCFLMLLWAKLNVASRRGNQMSQIEISASTVPLMKDRVKHALGVSGMMADAVRLNVNCDPFVGVQAYTSLEVLLFDPLRLNRSGETINPKGSQFANALAPLLSLIRRLSSVDVIMNHLRVEACRRLARCGFTDIMIHSDWEACRLYPISGRTDVEFDFRFFRWHRYANLANLRARPSIGTSQAAEALLDLGCLTSYPSQANTPEPDGIDARTVLEDRGIQPETLAQAADDLSGANAANRAMLGADRAGTTSTGPDVKPERPISPSRLFDRPARPAFSPSNSNRSAGFNPYDPNMSPTAQPSPSTYFSGQPPQPTPTLAQHPPHSLSIHSLLSPTPVGSNAQVDTPMSGPSTSSQFGTVPNQSTPILQQTPPQGQGQAQAAGNVFSEFNLPEGQSNPNAGITWFDVQRWVDLDYQPQRENLGDPSFPGLEINGLGGGPGGFGGFGPFNGIEGVGHLPGGGLNQLDVAGGGTGMPMEDFARLLERAGYGQQDTDPMSWAEIFDDSRA